MLGRDPFGQKACEAEVKALGLKYSDIYFDESPFNQLAIDDDTYIIIGRRGAGKTALSQYFSFQTSKPNPIYIEVNQPDLYQEVLSDISRKTSESPPAAVAHLKRVWEYVIWSLIFAALRNDSPTISEACKVERRAGGLAHYVAAVIQHLMGFFGDQPDGRYIGPRLERLIDDENLGRAKQAALDIALKRPIIIALDTMEQYDIKNDALMNAIAALVEYAAAFNQDYAASHIHLKVFMAGEVFPYINESVLLNPSKAINHPIYLLWRPRDLLRLISWRFYRYLEASNRLPRQIAGRIKWESDDDVLEKVWVPHFGRSITNIRGHIEETWPYVLRHTQMRPRQLITMCNNIANRAIAESTFPHFTPLQITEGIREAELELSSEILNSYSSIYSRNVSQIVAAGLQKIPMFFDGSELDRRARLSAPEWDGNYSPSNFRQLVAELGIVGRVTRGDESTEFIDADFEYALPHRLNLTHLDKCVIHPMFYRKLSVVFTGGKRVMPFATRREER
ncbi:MAG: hypothetical protein QOI58_2033 [Thermoanaerobaculia bacterium]|jgi:hypothetical protein|nr:hypothetical protein [Thermoanaerobaculia bacterium]